MPGSGLFPIIDTVSQREVNNLLVDSMQPSGSGTSDRTLASLFTIGSGIGAVMGASIVAVAPAMGVDVRIVALVGMAAIFAEAS